MLLLLVHSLNHSAPALASFGLFRTRHRVPADVKARFAFYQRFELAHSPNTVRAYLHRIDYAEQICGKSADQIGAEDLRVLKRTAALSSGSIKGIVVAVRQFHLWGELEGLWPHKDTDLVRTPKVEHNNPRPLPLDKARVLLVACRSPLEMRLVYLGLYAGMRIGESALIEGSMWHDDVLHFRGLKTAQIRDIPIHVALAKVKWQVLAHPPTYDSTMQRVKRRLEAKVGFPFVAHQLRKTFATQLYDQGVDDRIVKQLLGHSSDVTARYVEVSERRLREAIETLTY